MFDDEYVSQREIEKELFEKFDRDSERSLSLLKFVFVTAGFYAVALFYMYNELDIKLIIQSSPYPPESNYSIKLCFVTLVFAFYFSFKPLSVVRYKFVETEKSIEYRNGHELIKNNRRVALNIRRQGYYNMLSTYCILLSFLFFLGYFLGRSWFALSSCIAIITFVNFIKAWTEIDNIEQEGR